MEVKSQIVIYGEKFDSEIKIIIEEFKQLNIPVILEKQDAFRGYITTLDDGSYVG